MGQCQFLTLAQKDAPPAFEFSLAQRQGAQGALSEFFAGDPWSENAYTQPKLNESLIASILPSSMDADSTIFSVRKYSSTTLKDSLFVCIG